MEALTSRSKTGFPFFGRGTAVTLFQTGTAHVHGTCGEAFEISMEMQLPWNHDQTQAGGIPLKSFLGCYNTS